VAVFDREPAEMRKAAGRGHVHHARARLACEQLASCAVEADVAQRLMRALAEERPELALQRAGGQAGGCGKFGDADIALQTALHEIERTAHRARQHRCSRRYA
jgi:hypothetical protein